MLSSVDLQNAALAGAAPIAGWLDKPIRPSQVMDMLARVIARTAPVAPSPTRPAEPAQASPDETARRTVLVAEDNAVNQLVAANMIDSPVLRTAIAANGAAAVEMFLRLRPDAILMDVSMPILDGLDAARRIREIEAIEGRARTPIIAVTAHALDDDRKRCFEAGMDDFLAKPLRKAELDEALARWLSDARTRAA
jgi:CheY-like chemotaxis protein